MIFSECVFYLVLLDLFILDVIMHFNELFILIIILIF